MGLRMMTARYAGTCGVCDESIDVGEEIAYDGGQRRAYHASCAELATAPAPFRVFSHTAPFISGQTVANPNTGWRREGQPDVVTVVRVGYIPIDEDNDDFEETWWADCRAATDDEAAPVLAEQARQARRREALGQVRTIIAEVRSDGEQPHRDTTPTGEVIWERTVIGMTHLPLRGGGYWLILADDGLWFIEGNGGDGDDWSASNLPGAIGWRLGVDETRARELRQIAQQLA